MPDVTVCIPTIPPRTEMLQRALKSVYAQTYPPTAISIAVDIHREGAWATRQRALDAARTTWVAFLDDDDEFLPCHLEDLLACATENDADFCYSWFTGTHSGDPLGHFGKPFDAANPHHTTMTVLVKTELAQAVGFTPPRSDQIAGGEDWRFLLGCLSRNAKVVHLPKRTWDWHWHSSNTSGQPDKW